MKKTDRILDLLYPPKCPGCEDIRSVFGGDYGFCPDCKKKIVYIAKKKNTCLKCGKNLGESTQTYCNDCRDRKHFFSEGKALYEYGGPIKEALYRYKYSNKRIYSRVFARDAIRFYKRWIEIIAPDVIVPVPMYKKKKAQRGYNQAEEFAKELSRVTGIPMDKEVVIRAKKTSPLKELGARERAKALKRVFVGTKRFKRKAKVLLVDDIYTTGSTVDAVSEVLLEVGAGKVYAICIAIGKNT